MTPVLVDSNVLLDLATEDAAWAAWSEATVRRLLDEARLVINAVIFAEVSVGYATFEDVERFVPAALYARERLPLEAAFVAGKCFQTYRRRGGAKTSPLPDFFIGAHAAVTGYRLLTRDPRRYRTYFPKVELVAPPEA